mmetsp:Transcript_8673/g.18978  ORF Transcript_8673/g.18978 Transcript_8673/m.18978 type:complete len:93 (+) Transcript_8673:194-472(+)
MSAKVCADSCPSIPLQHQLCHLRPHQSFHSSREAGRMPSGSSRRGPGPLPAALLSSSTTTVTWFDVQLCPERSARRTRTWRGDAAGLVETMR